MQGDERAFGVLFYAVSDELSDIKFTEVFFLLKNTFHDTEAEKLFLTEEELGALMVCFRNCQKL